MRPRSIGDLIRQRSCGFWGEDGGREREKRRKGAWRRGAWSRRERRWPLRWLQMVANQSICQMPPSPPTAQPDTSFIQLSISLECPKIKSLRLSYESASFVPQCLGRLDKRASIISIAGMIKAGFDRLHFVLKSQSTIFHLPGNWPHFRRTQCFQEFADPGPGVAVYRKKLIVSTFVTLLGRWGFVTPANGTEFASRLELLHVTTKLVNGLFDLSHHIT